MYICQTSNCQISCYCLKDLESNPTLAKEWSFQRKNYFINYQVGHKSILDLQLESFVPKFHHSTWTSVNLRCLTMYTYYASILAHVMLGSFSFKSQGVSLVVLKPYDIYSWDFEFKISCSILRLSHRIPLCNNLVYEG